MFLSFLAFPLAHHLSLIGDAPNFATRERIKCSFRIRFYFCEKIYFKPILLALEVSVIMQFCAKMMRKTGILFGEIDGFAGRFINAHWT